MLEKRLYAVSPQLITANGSATGYINVANACNLLKVKQKISITDSIGNFKELEVKRVDEPDRVYLGPISTPIGVYSDLSVYTTANGSFVFADEQQRPKVPEEQIPRAVYAEEPTVAIRSVLVDPCGKIIDKSNPLPVAATFDGTVQVGDVRITAYANDPVAGDLPSSVRVSDGINQLKIYPDGSINVNFTTLSSSGLDIKYNEITAVGSASETTVISFTAIGSGYRVDKIIVAGENIALFKVKLNGNTMLSKRTFFGNLNEEFSFEDFANGLRMTASDTISVTVIHNRPTISNFESTIFGLVL